MTRFQVVRDLWVHGDVDASEIVSEHATREAAEAWMRDPANQWRKPAGSSYDGATDRIDEVRSP
jgi:hypothetical protein